MKQYKYTENEQDQGQLLTEKANFVQEWKPITLYHMAKLWLTFT